MAREPIEGYVRPGETPPAGTHLLLRGSPLTVVKFAEHAARTARAYTYRGEACVGISVELSTSAGETATTAGATSVHTETRRAHPS